MTTENNITPVLVEHQIEGNVIPLRDDDCYVSATAMCKAAGKLIGDYRRNAATKEYFEALSADMGIPITALIQTLKGGNDKNMQGTWVHPKVAIHLAQWLSPQFAVQVTNWVHDWMSGEGSAPAAYQLPEPPSKTTPIIYKGSVVLMIHQPKADWVAFSTLCEATGLSYRHHAQKLDKEEYPMRDIVAGDETLLCLTYNAALKWLGDININRIVLSKRTRLIDALRRLPELLSKAKTAYRSAVNTVVMPRLEELDSTRKALVAQLQQIEGEDIAVFKCADIAGAYKQLTDFHRNSFMESTQLSSALMRDGYTMRTLRGLA